MLPYYSYKKYFSFHIQKWCRTIQKYSYPSVHLVVIICTVPCSTMFTPWLFNDHPGKARQGLFANINVATNLTSENRPRFLSFAKLKHYTVNIRTLDFYHFTFFCVKFNSVSHLATSNERYFHGPWITYNNTHTKSTLTNNLSAPSQRKTLALILKTLFNKACWSEQSFNSRISVREGLSVVDIGEWKAASKHEPNVTIAGVILAAVINWNFCLGFTRTSYT